MTESEAVEQEVVQDPGGGAMGVWAVGFILAGWVVAVVLGHGWELHRIVLSVPFLIVGAFLVCGEILCSRAVVWKPALLWLTAGVLYFVMRAILSPVADFGRADALLVTMFAISFLAGAVCLRSRSAVTLLLKVLILVFVAHFLVSLYQRVVDPSFAVFRLPRIDQDGVSGLFWHRNYLAGMLELMLPVFVAVFLATRLSDWRAVVGMAVLLGLILLFFTQSRAGLMSAVIGMGTVVGIFMIGKAVKWSTNKRLAAVAAVIAVAVGIGWLGLVTTSRVSEQRGQSGSIEEALSANGRLAFAGMAFDQWTERPVWGTGSRSFSYKALDHWNAAPWVGDPRMVHNDYMQVLAEYGLPGIILVGGFAAALLLRGYLRVRRTKAGKDDDGLERGLMIGATGALVAAMVHGIFDFSLHILPNLILFGLLAGFLVRPDAADEEDEEDEEDQGDEGDEEDDRDASRGGLPVKVALAVLVISAAVSLAASRREIAVFPQWIRWEAKMVSLAEDEPMAAADLDAMGRIVNAAPEFAIARKYGRRCLAAYQRDPLGEAPRLAEAEAGFRLATDRNPHDAEALAHLAYVLDLQGRLEEGTSFHVRAVDRSWRREGKYGAMAALSANLARRAERHLYKLQRPKALGLFQRALEYLDASRRTGFRAGGARQSKDFRKLLAARIEALQSEGVELESPADVPPPPQPDAPRP
ncbi:MAG: O-antigen ligase family protein [Akkermansiaceae bacterium]|nr:O-antigen ligase family protein [Akkermansiaceae bacterium]